MSVRKLFFKYGVYLPATLLRGQNVLGQLRSLERSQYWDAPRLRDAQLTRLNSLITQARQHVPYYGQTLAGVAGPLRSVDEIVQLPTLTKAQLRQNQASIVSTARNGRPVKKTTGGSTGEPLTILKSTRSLGMELAATWRGYRWAGVDIGDRQARFWGVPLTSRARADARLTDFICNRYRCSAFGFTDADLARYDEALGRVRPAYFYGYVSMLTAFADYYVRQGRRPDYRLQCIITTSEVLTPANRELLERVFATRVFNEYGCGELGTIAHECERGSLHLSEENMIVELLKDDEPCAPGEMGELVVTELNNTTMPLIRYRTGDFAAFAAEPCGCGRTLRTISNLYGRAYDFVVTRSGKRFHGEMLMYIFEEAKREGRGIAQFQARQETIDRFRVLLVPGKGFDPATIRHLDGRMRDFLGHDLQIDFEVVDHIARERSGKMRVIVGMPS